MNAPPEFNQAMEKYSSSRTTAEKIKYLQEALRWLPKHKGTENMRKQLMKRLAELRRELLKEKQRKRGSGQSFLVPKKGYQVVVWGFANSGKSYVLSELSGAEIKSTPVPLETDRPTPVMVDFGGGFVQFVELPSYFQGFEGSKFANMVFASVRAADHLCIVVDLEWDPGEQVRTLVKTLQENDIYPNKDPPPVKVEKQASGGIRFVGEDLLVGEKEEFLEVLQMYGIHNAVIVPYGKITPDDLFTALDPGSKFIPLFLLGNKRGFEEDFLSLPYPKAMYRGPKSKEDIFRALNLVRVYTKPPRGEVSRSAVVLPRGSTPEDLAEIVFGRRKVRSVRLWEGSRYRLVPRDYTLRDGDVIELR